MQNSVLIHSFADGPVFGQKPKPVPQAGEVLVKITGTKTENAQCDIIPCV